MNAYALGTANTTVWIFYFFLKKKETTDELRTKHQIGKTQTSEDRNIVRTMEKKKPKTVNKSESQSSTASTGHGCRYHDPPFKEDLKSRNIQAILQDTNY